MPRRPGPPTLKARVLRELRRRSPLSTSELADLCAADRANRQASALAALCQLEVAGAVRREGKAARGRGRPSVLWGLAPTCARDRKREGFRLAKRGVRMKPVIFFDMDGVLCDFVGGALALHGRTGVPRASVPWGIEAHLGIDPAAFWAPMGFAFWRDLAPLHDGFRLLDHAFALVGAERIGLLTSRAQRPKASLIGSRLILQTLLPQAIRLRHFKHCFARASASARVGAYTIWVRLRSSENPCRSSTVRVVKELEPAIGSRVASRAAQSAPNSGRCVTHSNYTMV